MSAVMTERDKLAAERYFKDGVVFLKLREAQESPRVSCTKLRNSWSLMAPKYSTSVDESEGARCRHDMNEVRKSLVSVVVRDG
jgi:hypothetical protein